MIQSEGNAEHIADPVGLLDMPTCFESISEHTLDPKGRLNIPSRFRDVLTRVYNTELLKVIPWKQKSKREQNERVPLLRVYPVPEWAGMIRSLNKGDAKARGTADNMLVRVTECQVDKLGRILLPQKTRQYGAIDKDVVLVGGLKRFEIWDKAVWENEFESRYAASAYDDMDEALAAIGF